MHSILVTLETLVRTGVASNTATLVQNNKRRPQSCLPHTTSLLACCSCISERDSKSCIKGEHSDSLHCKLQTRPLVREGTLQEEQSNCH
jgi:hypothetical protein